MNVYIWRNTCLKQLFCLLFVFVFFSSKKGRTKVNDYHAVERASAAFIKRCHLALSISNQYFKNYMHTSFGAIIFVVLCAMCWALRFISYLMKSGHKGCNTERGTKLFTTKKLKIHQFTSPFTQNIICVTCCNMHAGTLVNNLMLSFKIHCSSGPQMDKVPLLEFTSLPKRNPNSSIFCDQVSAPCWSNILILDSGLSTIKNLFCQIAHTCLLLHRKPFQHHMRKLSGLPCSGSRYRKEPIIFQCVHLIWWTKWAQESTHSASKRRLLGINQEERSHS